MVRGALPMGGDAREDPFVLFKDHEPVRYTAWSSLISGVMPTCDGADSKWLVGKMSSRSFSASR